MKKLAILVSGGGSNMAAIINACEQGQLKAKVELVISNNRDCLAIEKAKKKNIDTAHMSSLTHANEEDLDQAMKTLLADYHIDFVLLAGFMKKIGSETLLAYKNRIINIHPSLLPKFGGQGMFGENVHQAVIKAGETKSGATIHLVDGEYDKGAILAQSEVSVEPEDTAKTLALKVLKLEHVLFSETIQKIIDGSIILPAD